MSKFSAYEYRTQLGFDQSKFEGEPGHPDEDPRDPLL